jgi:hypothetical protein
MLAGLVHCFAAPDVVLAQEKRTGRAKPQPTATQALPPAVKELRDAILAAVQSGNIEDLQTALEWNELRPILSNNAVDDPIDYWKKVSGDGEGREILAILANILAAGHTTLPLGKDIENNLVYVWPAAAEARFDALTPAQEVALLRLVSPAELKAMREKKRWTGYRLVIGADGTWHSFQKHE